MVPWAPCDPLYPVLGAGDRLGHTAPASRQLMAEGEQRATLRSTVPSADREERVRAGFFTRGRKGWFCLMKLVEGQGCPWDVSPRGTLIPLWDRLLGP